MSTEAEYSPRSSRQEAERRAHFLGTFEAAPIPGAERLYSQLGLFLPRQELSRILALADLYRENILHANGVLMEFGTWRGRTAALLTNLRGIFEPFNFTRKLVIFDTFTGLRDTGKEDGGSELAVDGTYASGPGYEKYLEDVLAFHEAEAPIAHRKKFEIVKGNASESLPAYLAEHPETIVAMAYFDFDLYAPTKACLQALRPYLAKNSILVFDQLNCPEFPGEGRALAEAIGLGHTRLMRSPLTPWLSYTDCEEIAGSL